MPKMKLNEALNISERDFMRMTKKELSRAVSAIGNAANKRAARLENAGISSPAAEGLKRSGGRIDARGKTLDELRREYVRGRSFIEAKTSTVTGAKKVQAEFAADLGVDSKTLTQDDLREIWSAYHRLEEDKTLTAKLRDNSGTIIQSLFRTRSAEDKTIDEMHENAVALLDELYKEQQKIANSGGAWYGIQQTSANSGNSARSGKRGARSKKR